MDVRDLLPFIKEIDRLKSIERQSLLHNGGRRENTAEHSWHLAMSVMVFEKLAPQKIDLGRAVKMALLHDVVEIDAGDTFVYDDLSGKKEKEAAAFERIFGLLPQIIRDEFREIWMDFEEGKSAESQFVSALDRFLPIFSNYLNHGHSWQAHGITSTRVIDRCKAPIEGGLPELWQRTAEMLEESVQKGYLGR